MRSDHRGFEDFDNPLEISERRPRKQKPRRALSAWEQQAETWHGPEHAFECCGTTYRAMGTLSLELMRQTHDKLRHGG